MSYADHHEVLGVREDASPEEIKNAYWKLAKIHHPDRGGSEEEFKKIKEAYENLAGNKTNKGSGSPAGENDFDLFEWLKKIKTPHGHQGPVPKGWQVCPVCGGSGMENAGHGNNRTFMFFTCSFCRGEGIVPETIIPKGEKLCGFCQGVKIAKNKNGNWLLCPRCIGKGLEPPNFAKSSLSILKKDLLSTESFCLLLISVFYPGGLHVKILLFSALLLGLSSAKALVRVFVKRNIKKRFFQM